MANKVFPIRKELLSCFSQLKGSLTLKEIYLKNAERPVIEKARGGRATLVHTEVALNKPKGK